MTLTTRWTPPLEDDQPRPGDTTPGGDEAGAGTMSRRSSAGAIGGESPTNGRELRAVERYRAVARGRAASDVLCAVVAFLYVGFLEGDGRSVPASFILVALAAPFLWTTVFATFGLYGARPMTRLSEFHRIVRATVASTALTLLGSVWVHPHSLRTTFVVTTLVALVLEVATREAWRLRLARLERQGALSFRTLIVGTDAEAARLARGMLRSDHLRFHALGYVAVSGPRGPANGLKVLGTIDDLSSTIRKHRVDHLFVASTGVSPGDMAELSRVARREDVDVRVSANLPNILTTRVSVEPVADLTALSIKTARLTPGKAAAKRLFDFSVASCALIAALPVMAVVALAVRLTSAGPVFFRQSRVTKDGATFRIFKFRTMVHEPYIPPALSEIDPTTPYFKLDNDPRLTRVGGLLRRYSLDELPQLWNVIRGDISLVGPRPLWSVQVDPLSDIFRCRHEVRTGLTGWWQVNGRSDVDVEAALQMDLFYVENWSLALDMRILLNTIPVVLKSRGAY